MELLESSYLPSNLNLQHKHIKKNTYFGNWATRKQSPHKKRGHTVELKFNLPWSSCLLSCRYKFSTTSNSIHTNPKDAALVVI